MMESNKMSEFIKVEAIIHVTAVVQDNGVDDIKDQALETIKQNYALRDDDDIEIKRVFK